MQGRLLITITAAVLAAAVGTAEAKSPRPDLRVSAGTLQVSSGAVSGSFTVANAGRRRAGSSRAVLVVPVGGQDRTLETFKLSALRAGRDRRVTVSVPAGALSRLPAGTYRLRVCADGRNAVRERSEHNNCKTVGRFTVAGNPGGTGTTGGGTGNTGGDTGNTGGGTGGTTGDQGLPAPCATPVCAPVPYQKGNVTKITDAAGSYWVHIPQEYDDTNQTPTKVLVWLHGCGGDSEGGIWSAADYYDGMTYITLAPDGAEGGCWNTTSHPKRVMTAINDIQARFRIDPRRIVIGGYSSGGDLAYRTAFYNAKTFAGVLAINTAPFRDTGSTQQQSLAAAAWKFPVVHVAHLGDTTYPIDQVRAETDAMTAAGFPMQRIERQGTHWDPDTADPNDQPGTDEEIKNVLLKGHMGDNWQSPAP